jgi:hypothetical protein
MNASVLGSARLQRAGFGILPKQSCQKSANAGCIRQHARRVRSPEYVNAHEAIRRVGGGIVRARIRG